LEMARSRQPTAGNHEVCLTSISWSTDEDAIRRHFADCGNIKKVVIFRERQDVERSGKKKGNSMGRGKIVFTSAEAVSLALNKNLTTLDNWTICVSMPTSTQLKGDARYWHDTRVIHPPPKQICRESCGAASLPKSGEQTRGWSTTTALAGANQVMQQPYLAKATSSSSPDFPKKGDVCGLEVNGLNKWSFRYWLEVMDGKGNLLQYQEVFEQMFDSLLHLISVYVNNKPGETPVFDESLFDDVEISKVAHKRMIKRWFESIGCIVFAKS